MITPRGYFTFIVNDGNTNSGETIASISAKYKKLQKVHCIALYYTNSQLFFVIYKLNSIINIVI